LLISSSDFAAGENTGILASGTVLQFTTKAPGHKDTTIPLSSARFYCVLVSLYLGGKFETHESERTFPENLQAGEG
jgi:hypothetical protein